jgi:hypothetical protein
LATRAVARLTRPLVLALAVSIYRIITLKLVIMEQDPKVWVGFIWLRKERHMLRALVHMVMNLRVTYNAGKFLNTWENF